MKEVFDFFISPRYRSVIVRFVEFSVKSTFKYWKLSLSITLIFGGLLYGIFGYASFTFFHFIPLYAIFAAVNTIGITGYYGYKESCKLLEQPTQIAVYGSFSAKQKEYLTSDIFTEEINRKIDKIVSSVSNEHYCYRKGFAQVKFINLPSFLPPLLGYSALVKFIQKRIASKYHAIAIYFIDKHECIETTVVFNESDFKNNEYLTELESISQGISKRKDVDKISAVEKILSLYLMALSDSFLAITAPNRKSTEMHQAYDSSEHFIQVIRSNIADEYLNGFLNKWLSHFHRERALLFLEQNELRGAIISVFKSINLNPNFPYANFADLKKDLTYRYAIDLSSAYGEMATTPDALELEIKKIDNTLIDEFKHNIRYKDIAFSYDVIKAIIEKIHKQNSINTDRLLSQIEQELKNLNENEPLCLLIRSEVLKHLRSGVAIFNNIYVDRIDECIYNLKKILEIDPEIPLIHTKIGALYFTKYFYYNNESFMHEGAKYYDKGNHIFNQLFEN